MSAMSDTYARVRAEIVALFGWDADKLSSDQKLRLDCAVALRLALDDLQGRVVRGESVDVAKMLAAADALSRFLPAAVLAEPPPPSRREDPRQYMWRTYLDARRRGELADPMSTYEGRGRRIAELEAKIAELESEVARLTAGAPASGAAPQPSASAALSNVVPLSRPPATSAPAPAAPQYDYNKVQGWKDYVEPTGEIRSTPRGRWDV
jgi:hypothetical protein